MRISQRSVEQVKETANIVEVASEFTALKRAGASYSGLCPFHTEKSPSFTVNPEKGFYHCFGCGVGGDAIKLVMELKALPFAEAVTHLAERFGVELELEGRSPGEERAAHATTARRRASRKALAAAAAYYHKYLLKSPDARGARDYLKSRGFDSSTIEEFRLGYAPRRGMGGFSALAGKVGLDRGALEGAGLLSQRGGERFGDRVTFPISDRQGRILGFGARALGDAKPKYLNSPETELFNKRALLYGFPQVAEAVRRERSALVVEGYTDVLMLYQSGIKNAVATLGTALTEQHLKTLSGYADEILLLFDPDDAGEKAVERAAVISVALKLDLRVLRLTDDPADWLLEHPAEEFRGLLSGAVPVLEYVFRRKAEGVRGAGAAERSRVLGEIRSLLKEISDPVFRRDGIRLAAEALGVTPETLLANFREEAGALGEAPLRASATNGASRSPHAGAGRELLAHALARPDLAAEPFVRGIPVPGLAEPLTLTPEDFAEDPQSQLFALLRDHAGKDLDAALADERARPLLGEISALSAAGERLYTSAASLEAAWLRLGSLSRDRAKKLAADDLEAKYRLQSEAKLLNRAAVEASNRTLEP